MLKSGTLLFTFLLVLPGCGRFDFLSRLTQEGRIAEATFVTMDLGSDIGVGVCSPLKLEAWAEKNLPGGSLTSVPLRLSGLRAGDLIFSDEACLNSVNANALSIEPFAVSRTYYIRTGTSGTLDLLLSSTNPRFNGATTSVRVGIVLAAIASSTTSLSIGAGFCSSPITARLLDGQGNPFNANLVKIEVSGAAGLVFADPACIYPLPDAVLTVTGSQTTFYMRRNSAKNGNLSLKLRVAQRPDIAPVTIAASFLSVPYGITIGGGPASRSALGACELSAFHIELRDVDGSLTSPLSAPLYVSLGAAGGSSVEYRTSCDSMGTVVTSASFGPGTSSQSFFLTPKTVGNLVLTADSIGVQDAQRTWGVDRLPISFVVNGPSAILAGSPATYTITALDGLGAAMSVTSAIPVTLSESTAGIGTFAANPVTLSAGASQVDFTYTPKSDTALTTGLSLRARANVVGRLVQGSANYIVNPRVPVSVGLSGGPSGAVDLGVCQTTAFTVTLKDANGAAVAPASGQSVTVDLGFSAGSGSYRQSSCSGSPITQLVFASNQSSKTVLLTAQADNLVTLRVSATNLTAGTLNVNVKPAVPVSVAVAGPSAVTAGVPAGPYRVGLKDALQRPINAASAVSVSLGIEASPRVRYCTDELCVSPASSLSAPIAIGKSESDAFYLLSDYEGPPTSYAANLSASPAGSLTSGVLSLNFSRTSLANDPGFGAAGSAGFQASGFSGGEIRASAYANGKVTAAGFMLVSGVRRMAVGRFLADRGSQQATLDMSFGSSGFNTMTVGGAPILGEESWASALTLVGPDTFVVGTSKTANGYRMVALKVGASGAVDSTFRFNAGAPDPIPLAGNQYATAMAVGRDGTIYVVGYADAQSPSVANTADVVVVALSPAGAVLGSAFLDLGGGEDIAAAAVIQAFSNQDRLLIGATAKGGASGDDFAFARVLGKNGSSSAELLALDSDFGTAGVVRHDLSGSRNESLKAMVQMSSGRVIAVGSQSKAAGGSAAALLGIAGSNGSRDSTFGTQGVTIFDVAGAAAVSVNAVALDTRVSTMYLAGSADGSVLSIRMRNNGNTDSLGSPSARALGTAAAAYSLVLGQDAKPLLTGVNNGSWTALSLLR